MATATQRRSIVVGVFEDPRQSESAIRELRESGSREDQIRVEEARYIQSDVEKSRISVTIEADARSEEGEAILRRHGAVDVHTEAAPDATPAPSGAAAAEAPAAPAPRTGESVTIQLREEELHTSTQFVETGEVRVRKEAITVHRTIEVPVQREEVVIERHAPTGEPTSAPDLGPGEEFRIPVRKEQVIVEKRPVVKKEVTVGKRVVQDLEQVGGEVLKEEVRVEREGVVDIHDRGTGESST